jgi:hypothetical protein
MPVGHYKNIFKFRSDVDVFTLIILILLINNQYIIILNYINLNILWLIVIRKEQKVLENQEIRI